MAESAAADSSNVLMDIENGMDEVPEMPEIPQEVVCMICEAPLVLQELVIREHVSIEHFPAYRPYSCPQCHRKFATKAILNLKAVGEKFPCCGGPLIIHAQRDPAMYNQLNEAAQEMFYAHISAGFDEEGIAHLNEHLQTVTNRYMPLLRPPPFTEPERYEVQAPAPIVQQPTVPVQQQQSMQHDSTRDDSRERSYKPEPSPTLSFKNSIHGDSPAPSTPAPVPTFAPVQPSVPVARLDPVNPVAPVKPPPVPAAWPQPVPSSAAPTPSSDTSAQADQGSTYPIWVNCRSCGAVFLIPDNISTGELIKRASKHFEDYHGEKAGLNKPSVKKYFPEILKGASAEQIPDGALLLLQEDLRGIECHFGGCDGEMYNTIEEGTQPANRDCDLVYHVTHVHNHAHFPDNELFYKCFPVARGDAAKQKLKVAQGSQDQKVPAASVGVMQFVCNQPQCAQSFADFGSLKMHMFGHMPGMKCPYTGCTLQLHEYIDDLTFDQHLAQVHPGPSKRYDLKVDESLTKGQLENCLKIYEYLLSKGTMSDKGVKVYKKAIKHYGL